MVRTINQNSRFHTLLSQRKLGREEKAELVSAYTGGRTNSSKDMSIDEMAEVIKFLEDDQEKSIKKMRAKIIGIARDIFELKPRDQWTQDHYDNLNTFLFRKFKYPLHKLTYKDLPKAVTAISKWRDSEIKKIVENLLKDS